MGGLFPRYNITCNLDSPNEFYLISRRFNKAYVVLNLYFVIGFNENKTFQICYVYCITDDKIFLISF